MSRRRRDVSGLWEGSAEEPVDRSPGVAPPPRPASPVRDVGVDADPVVSPEEPVAGSVEASTAVVHREGEERAEVERVEDASAAPIATVGSSPAVAEPSGDVDPLALVKTSFSFTPAQLTHLHKVADRDDVWPSSLVGDLVREAEATIRATPRARRTKNRRGPKYVATTFYLERADRALLDELAESTGRSRAAVGRLAVDASME